MPHLQGGVQLRKRVEGSYAEAASSQWSVIGAFANDHLVQLQNNVTNELTGVKLHGAYTVHHLATPARTLHFNVVPADDPLTIIINPGIDKEVKKPRRFTH